MRIGVNCYLLRPEIGGIKQYFFSLFRELLANDATNEYIFFYFDHNLPDLENFGNDFWRQRSILLNSQQEVWKYLDKIDLYFCPFGTLYPRPLPLPTVVTLVDIQEVFYPEFFTIRNLLARKFHYQGSTTMADRVVTISEFSRKSIIKHHGISSEKIEVSYLCADKRFYKAKSVAQKPARELPDRYIFYPANRWHHKNHDMLLRAMVWLRDEKQFVANAVFTGFDQANGYLIEKKAKEYGLSEQIIQLGYVSVEELAYLYVNAQMLVFPSLFEGFGIPLVEAMAAGCPVLSANGTSLPEVGGDSVSYFSPSSVEDLGGSILELINNESMRNDLVERGHEQAGKFSAARLAEDHLQIFTEAYESYSRRKYLINRCLTYFHIINMLSSIFFIRLRSFSKKFSSRCNLSLTRNTDRPKKTAASFRAD